MAARDGQRFLQTATAGAMDAGDPSATPQALQLGTRQRELVVLIEQGILLICPTGSASTRRGTASLDERAL